MLHAARHATRQLTKDDLDELDGPSDAVLLIGGQRDGTWLEVGVLDPETDPAVFHAMRLREKFYRYLPGGGG